jgi:excisionase family DNA binding protein
MATAYAALAALLTVSDVAELLSVHPYTVRRLIGAGDLPAIRVGVRALRVRREEIARFLDARAKPGVAAATSERPT